MSDTQKSKLSPEAKKHQYDYINEYKRTHVRRISLELKKDLYDRVKKEADKNHTSVNGFIKGAIVLRLKMLDDINKPTDSE